MSFTSHPMLSVGSVSSKKSISQTTQMIPLNCIQNQHFNALSGWNWNSNIYKSSVIQRKICNHHKFYCLSLSFHKIGFTNLWLQEMKLCPYTPWTDLYISKSADWNVSCKGLSTSKSHTPWNSSGNKPFFGMLLAVTQIQKLSTLSKLSADKRVAQESRVVRTRQQILTTRPWIVIVHSMRSSKAIKRSTIDLWQIVLEILLLFFNRPHLN